MNCPVGIAFTKFSQSLVNHLVNSETGGDALTLFIDNWNGYICHCAGAATSHRYGTTEPFYKSVSPLRTRFVFVYLVGSWNVSLYQLGIHRCFKQAEAYPAGIFRCAADDINFGTKAAQIWQAHRPKRLSSRDFA